MKHWKTLFWVLLLLACEHRTPVTPNGETHVPQWPMFRHDVRHTGNVNTDPYGGIVGPRGPNVTVKWSFDSHSRMVGSPAIDKDGTIYFGTVHRGTGGAGPDSLFYALNADGTVKWKFGALGITGTSSSPAIATDGTIYCVSRIAVFAFNPDGSLRWKLKGGVEGWSTPALGPDGTLYWCDYHHLNAVTPDGIVKWQFDGSDDFGLPVVGTDGIIYYNHYDRRTLIAVYPDGTTKWEYTDAGGIIFDSVVIDGEGSIYFLNHTNETLYSVSKGGHLKWKIAGIGPIKEINSPAIAPDGTIIVAGSDSLYAISATGQRVWKALCENINSPPVIDAEGNIYLTNRLGPVISCYSRSGILKWRVTDIPYGAVIGGTPLGSDGTLFFGYEYDPHVYALY